MTLIQADVFTSGGQPLTGFIQVTLDGEITNDENGKVYLPVPSRFTLVNGGIGFDLEPSEDDRTTYRFEVYQTSQFTPEPTEDNPSPSPVTLEVLYKSFHALVPERNMVEGVEVPLPFADLASQTSISRDNLDASLNTVIRRLTTSTEFWVAANTNLFRVKGVYNAAYSYIQGDVVNFDGSAWVCVSLVSLVNQNPLTYPEGWRLLVSRGDTGSGTTGSNTPYDKDVWVDSVAPSRVALRNVIETLGTKASVATKAEINSPLFTGTPSRNASPVANDSSGQLANTAWVQALIAEVRKAVVPVGLVAACPHLSPPTGWLRCDGRTLDRTTYSALFAVLSTIWNTGGELATEFRLPDLRGRTIQGLDDMGTARGAANVITPANGLGSTGGEQRHTMTLAEMVSHAHVIGGGLPFPSNNFSSATITAGTNDARGLVNNTAYLSNTNSAGSSTPFNVMQPYSSLCWCIYTGL